MSSVVSFLTMLERDVQESNGQVKRMLSVCSEFERIAKVVLDKAERDMRGRGKRKQAERERERDRLNGAISAELDDGKTLEQIQVETQAPYRRPVQTDSLRATGSQAGSGAGASPVSWNGSQQGGNASYGGPGAQYLQDQQRRGTPQTSNGQWNPAPFAMPPGQPNDQPQDNMNTSGVDWAQINTQAPPTTTSSDFIFNLPNTYDTTSPSMGTSNGGNIPTTVGGAMDSFSFQQPFVPQDLWQMPMTLEWDWAEGLGMGSFTPGPFFNDQDGYLAQTGVGPGGGMFDQGDGQGQG